MPLHIIKLCVGVETVEELDQWYREEVLVHAARGESYERIHVTRMFPKRVDEILDGGSLYWVIKGIVQVRQRILELRPIRGGDGIERCGLVLDPELHRTEYKPCFMRGMPLRRGRFRSCLTDRPSARTSPAERRGFCICGSVTARLRP
ncbi:MAG: hypothetical protein H6R00_272 [Proteobacteria bacterium]|nr:hypothetical protein [Pseudomonadota bacterium]